MKKKTTGSLVEVALNRPVWDTFTYNLPASMTGGDPVGCRVVVPFGNSDLVGYVWDIGMSCGNIEVKDVLHRLDSSPLLPGKMLKLLRWLSNYYQAPPGMMMSAAHPPGTGGRAERVLTLQRELDPDHPLSDFLAVGREVPAAILRDNLRKDLSLDALLSGLEAEGTVLSRWRPASGPRPVMEKMIEACMESSATVRKADSLRRRSPKQAEILFHLGTAGTSVPLRQLLSDSGASSSSLKGLLAKGLVREYYRRKPRIPFLDTRLDGSSGIPVLTGPQKEAVETIRGSYDSNMVFLLHGVTGSGKTEVYLRVISDIVARGQSALVLVPEISLTPLTVSRFSRRFPGLVTVMHSGMTPGERMDSWDLARQGIRRIVIGPRSAVFAPLPNVGIIVVDEEHDSSYKQNELPRYNGRDVAVLRSSMENIPVILGSASPSMESYGNAESGRYELIRLDQRIDGIPMPVTRIIDASRMKHPLLSNELLEGIEERMSRRELSIVLINRRGFSPVQMCRNCGYREECPRCGVTLTYHRKGESLRCHYCDHWKPAMKICPECGFGEFSHLGPGIQKVEESLKQLLPGVRVIRMDADTTRGKYGHWDILGKFADGSWDVLLGTQMVAKGHDFPGVTLVGVIAADMGLTFPDFRASERTFQLLLQVAGRAGRGSVPGEVIIQTLHPENRTIKSAAMHDYSDFWKMESRVRKGFGYPPYGYLVRFVWSGLDRKGTQTAAGLCTADVMKEGVVLTPPQEAAFPRINRRWRFSTIAKSSSRKALAEMSVKIRTRFNELSCKGVRLDIDVDPFNLL